MQRGTKGNEQGAERHGRMQRVTEGHVGGMEE